MQVQVLSPAPYFKNVPDKQDSDIIERIAKGATSAFLDHVPTWLEKIKDHIVIPKNKKGKVGIVIALKTENKADAIKLKSDFVEELSKNFKTRRSLNIYLIPYPETISQRVTVDSVEKYAKKSRAHLVIYGHFKKRKDLGKEYYVFKLDGFVRHASIAIKTSKRFGSEFRELLQEKIQFPEDSELSGFEATEENIRYVAEYIIGIAAYLSFSFEYAIKIYSTLEAELKELSTSEILEKIKSRLRIRFIECYMALCQIDYYNFFDTRDPSYILRMKDRLDQLDQLDPNNVAIALLKAVYFYFEKKLDHAIDVLNAAKGRNPNFYFNLGFLHACKGNEDLALDNYKHAFNQDYSSIAITEIELFLNDEIENHPELPQLLFCRGLINYKAKNDMLLAQEDFKLFLQKMPDEQYPKFKELSNKYLSRIFSSNKFY